MGLLDGKVALITGGARGQGRAHALASAREGADVILFDVPDALPTIDYPMSSRADLEGVVKEVEALDRRALPIEGDVRSQAALDHAVAQGIAEFGQVDILIANAGVWSQAPLWEITEDDWDAMVGTILTGVWKSIKAVAPHMIDRLTGSIVMTASMNAHEAGANYSHYTAAKHGLIGLMQTAALELSPYGIRCNALSPGAVHSGMHYHQHGFDVLAGHEGGTEEEYWEAGYRYHTLKGFSMLSPDRVADAALFLNSDLASAITGATIPVDAGHLLLPRHNWTPNK